MIALDSINMRKTDSQGLKEVNQDHEKKIDQNQSDFYYYLINHLDKCSQKKDIKIKSRKVKSSPFVVERDRKNRSKLLKQKTKNGINIGHKIKNQKIETSSKKKISSGKFFKIDNKIPSLKQRNNFLSIRTKNLRDRKKYVAMYGHKQNINSSEKKDKTRVKSYKSININNKQNKGSLSLSVIEKGKKRHIKSMDLKTKLHISTDKKTGNESSIKNDNSGNVSTSRELSFVVEKYENNVQKFDIKPDNILSKNADKVFEKIIKQFDIIVKEGGGEAKLTLKPEILGNLKLNIKLSNNEVTTNMIVENHAVRDLILSKLNILENNLLQQGFSIGSFQVEVKDKNANLNMEREEIKNGFKIKSVQEKEKLEYSINSGLPWMSTIINLTA